MQRPHREYEKNSYEELEKSFGHIDPDKQYCTFSPSEENKPPHY